MSSGFLPRCFFFFFNDTATTEIYTLSLHDALPIYAAHELPDRAARLRVQPGGELVEEDEIRVRSEEHTSELQSLTNLVCRLLLEKKKTITKCRKQLNYGEELYSGVQL